MKLMQKIAREERESMKDERAILCEYVNSPFGILPLQAPILSTEKSCDWCGGTEHFTPCVDPSKSKARSWLCGDRLCKVYNAIKSDETTKVIAKPSRAILWPLFCEINGIGDKYHDVVFENVDQSEGKISYMLKFSVTPKGILLMRGDTGTGKTYSAMAICELYTRNGYSCIFTTAKNMSTKWHETFKDDKFNDYIYKITNTELLVIDDFGTSKPPDGFLGFFMELINSRCQWKKRGTVITSNLNIKTFNEYCGDALADRIMTGQQFEFIGNSRREKTIL